MLVSLTLTLFAFGLAAVLIGLSPSAANAQSGAAPTDFVLVENGKPSCQVVLPGGASELSRQAAARLQSVMREVGGVELPVVTEIQAAPARGSILLGSLEENAAAADFLRQNRIVGTWSDRVSVKRILIPDNLGPEGFVIYAGQHRGQPALALNGQTPRAGLYAVETVTDRIFQEGNRALAGPLNSDSTPVLNLPAFRARGIVSNLGGPEWTAGGQWEKEWAKGDGYDWQGFVDWLVSHKLNYLNLWAFNLHFGLAYDSKRFPDLVNRHHPNVKREFVKDLIRYAHSRGIQVFFFVDFPDDWTAVIKGRPELAGKNVNPAEIPGGPEWEDFQKYGERRLGELGGAERFRDKYSWVCASEPKTLEFWKAYWEELLERYPDVDGIGGQFSEHTDTHRCKCPRCAPLENHFALIEKFFAEMVKIGRRANPQMKFWIYDSWGTRDILLHRDRYPNFIQIDWSGAVGALHYKQYLPRSNWYLLSPSGRRFLEFHYKYAISALNERGVEGVEILTGAYREYDNRHQAFEEFTWNPRLPLEEYARLYIQKLCRRRDPRLAELYAAWLNFLGYQALAGPPAGGAPFYEAPRQNEDAARAMAAREIVARSLDQFRDGPDLVEAIRGEFAAMK